MAVLYVTEPGAVVRKKVGSLLVTLDVDLDGAGPSPKTRQTLLEVEPHRIDLIAIIGRAHVTSDATWFCLQKGIDISWFSRNGKYLGRLVPQMSRSADLRVAQYASSTDPAAALKMAVTIVQSKLENAAEVLVGVQRNRRGDKTLGRGIADLRQMSIDASGCLSMDKLLGLEGMGARRYFEILGSAFLSDILFEGRVRRPPPDPANALLSFGYVLLGNIITGLLEARGLDPSLGFYHQLRPGRPSLALDMLEEFRHPVVDRFVLRMCNLRIMKPSLFEADRDSEGGVRLTRPGLKRFFQEWEKNMRKPVKDGDSGERIAITVLLRRQVDRMAADLRGGEAYRPFRFGG